MKDQPLIYHGSEGAELVAEMHLAKLGNVVRKIERQGEANQNFANLPAIKALYEKRQAAWDAEHPDESRR